MTARTRKFRATGPLRIARMPRQMQRLVLKGRVSKHAKQRRK